MLKIARDQAAAVAHRDSDRLSYHSASIILSRTCLEIFFNELYFLQIQESILSEQSTYYSHKKKKRITLNYNNFVDLHICERLEIALPNVNRELVDDVSLQNQIRNYCIHYTASDIKKQLITEFTSHPIFCNFEFDEMVSPQERYINQKTALWCNAVTLRTVISVEKGQTKAHSNSELNIEHCLDMLN